MAKTYLNKTENSPIRAITIRDTEILLRGQDERTLSMNDTSRVKNLLQYIDRTSKTKAVFVELYNYVMYNTSCIKRPFGYVDNRSNKIVEPVKIEDALQDWSIKRTKWLEEKANDQYLFMKKTIEDKAQKAREENKKLLVVMGEEHLLTDPKFFQVLAWDICKTIGIENVLLELPSTELVIPSKYTRQELTIHHYYDQDLFLNVLANSHEKTNISLHPIDPLLENYWKQTVSPKTRDQSINQSIKEVDQAALCVIGGSHIPHLMQLSEQYTLAIFHSANLAYVPYFKNASDKILTKWLKIHQSSASTAEKNIKEKLNSSSNESESKKLDLNPEFERYEASNRGQMYVMKSQMPKEIIHLSLKKDGTAKAIPSDTEALNIAATVIKQNNPTSPILIGLQTVQNNYKQLQNIQYCNQYRLKLNVDYLNGTITEEEHNKEQSSHNMIEGERELMHQILSFYSSLYHTLPDDESSDAADQGAQQPVINPDTDLTGNWDTLWPNIID